MIGDLHFHRGYSLRLQESKPLKNNGIISQASRHSRHPLCHGRTGLRTLSAPGHRHRLTTYGDPGPPGQGETRSCRDALSQPPATAAPLLEALSAQVLALSGPPRDGAHHPRWRGPYLHPSRPRRQAHQSRLSSSIAALCRYPDYAAPRGCTRL